MQFKSIDEKIKELISEGITDELSDRLAGVHKLIDDKFEGLNGKIASEIDEYVNTKKFKGYLAGIGPRFMVACRRTDRAGRGRRPQPRRRAFPIARN